MVAVGSTPFASVAVIDVLRTRITDETRDVITIFTFVATKAVV